MTRSVSARSGRNTKPVADAGRTLIYIPILHTHADMGTLAGSVRRVTVEGLGREALDRNVEAIDRLWARIRQTIESLPVSWKKVRLFQDGLPVCGRERQIVRALARARSPNHQLLLSLMRRGATLMGTESPKLLVEEYRLVRKTLAARDSRDAPKIQAKYAAQSSRLLVQRDRYIARRIDQSLDVGGTGILFLGMLHQVVARLAKDIQVSYPIFRPPNVVFGTNPLGNPI